VGNSFVGKIGLVIRVTVDNGVRGSRADEGVRVP